MPVLLYVHHLFNVDQCHAYIPTLRWKDRPPGGPHVSVAERAPRVRARAPTPRRTHQNQPVAWTSARVAPTLTLSHHKRR